jgi:hypothetical protein
VPGPSGKDVPSFHLWFLIYSLLTAKLLTGYKVPSINHKRKKNNRKLFLIKVKRIREQELKNSCWVCRRPRPQGR